MSPEREPMENDSNSRTAEELEQQTVDVYVERALHGPVFRMSYEQDKRKKSAKLPINFQIGFSRLKNFMMCPSCCWLHGQGGSPAACGHFYFCRAWYHKKRAPARPGRKNG